MKQLTLLFFWLFTLPVFLFGQKVAKTNDGKTVLLYNDGTWVYADSAELPVIKTIPIEKLEIPKTSPNDKIISHTAYSFLYNDKHEQANWVAYQLSKEHRHKAFERTNQFVPNSGVQ
jgi:endonuclease G